MVVCKERIKQYMYTAYGLNLKSEIELPELIPMSSRKYNLIDVNICYGKLPQKVRNITNETLIVSTEADNEYIFIKNIARYSVINGDTIVVDPYEGVDIKIIRSFLFSWVFSVLIKQRGILIDELKLNRDKNSLVSSYDGTIVKDSNYVVNSEYSNKSFNNTIDSLGEHINNWGLSIKKVYKGGYIISSGDRAVKNLW